MQSKIELSEFRCWNKDCHDYKKRGKGNIKLKGIYGNNRRALLKCKTCGHCFSETRGTLFFGLETPQEEILRTLSMVPEKGSIREVARATGHDKNTICRWLDISGAHFQKGNRLLFARA
ncbi:MAG: hypothetical protein SVJ22_11635 [Halobacteriota archaeon]|nr:hypothetical protein [Halobacteriota archaeon]